MNEPDAAYNVYARQLFPRRHGHPLWIPEPNKNNVIQIGDVGFLREGGFYRLFNTTRPSDDYLNNEGVPDSYTPFKIKPMLVNETKGIIKSHLCSQTVSSKGLSGEIVAPTTPVGAGLAFQCSTEQGAFVFTDKPADRTQMHPSRSFAHYMKTNIEQWHDLAAGHDLDIAKEDLIFISGIITTNDWGLGAFLHHGYHGEVRFQTQLGPFLQGSFQFNLTKGTVGNAELRVKPGEEDAPTPSPTPSPSIEVIEPPDDAVLLAPPSSRAHSTLSSTSTLVPSVTNTSKKDQCLFIHFYKMKKRFWRNKVVIAAAGSDQRDHNSSGDGFGPSVTADEFEVTEEPAILKSYNAVDSLLDYILDYVTEDGHKAEVAIASPAHLYAIFDGDLPIDIRGELDKMRPTVEFLDDDREMAALAFAEWSEDHDDVEGADNENLRDIGAQSARDLPEELDLPENDDDKYKAIRPGIGTAHHSVVLEEHTGGVTCIAYSPDGKYIASGSEDTHIILHNGATGAAIRTLTGHNDSIWTMAFSPDGSRLASGASDGLGIIWDMESRTLAAVLDGHSGVVQSIGYSPDGLKVVTASVDFTVRVWDALTGNTIHKLEGHRGVLISATFSPDGRWIGSCSADHTAKIWNVQTGTVHHSLDEHNGVVWAMAFSPDSRRVVTGSDDTVARVWNAETGDGLVTLREHHGPVWAVAFSPDGKRIMSASNDSTIKICDSFSGEQQHVFDRHDTLVNVALFSHDGRYVASSSGDNAIMVWNTTTGKHFPQMEGHRDKVTCLEFSPEDDRIVSASDDGSVRIWTLAGNPEEDD